jgi:hypothetical protein
MRLFRSSLFLLIVAVGLGVFLVQTSLSLSKATARIDTLSTNAATTLALHKKQMAAVTLQHKRQLANAVAKERAKSRLKRLIVAVPIIGTGAAAALSANKMNDWLVGNPHMTASDYGCELVYSSLEVMDEVLAEFPKRIRPSRDWVISKMPECKGIGRSTKEINDDFVTLGACIELQKGQLILRSDNPPLTAWMKKAFDTINYSVPLNDLEGLQRVLEPTQTQLDLLAVGKGEVMQQLFMYGVSSIQGSKSLCDFSTTKVDQLNHLPFCKSSRLSKKCAVTALRLVLIRCEKNNQDKNKDCLDEALTFLAPEGEHNSDYLIQR